MPISIRPIANNLPDGFEALRAEARAEGYSHLERLAAEWASGATRFDAPCEALLAASIEDALVGIGGLTLDPVERGAFRLRRFFVGAAFRRRGVGRVLAASLLALPNATKQAIVVNAAIGSAPFWERLGFVRDAQDGHSHRLGARLRQLDYALSPISAAAALRFS